MPRATRIDKLLDKEELIWSPFAEMRERGACRVTEEMTNKQNAFNLMLLHIRNGTPGFVAESAKFAQCFYGFIGKVPPKYNAAFHESYKICFHWYQK